MLQNELEESRDRVQALQDQLKGTAPALPATHPLSTDMEVEVAVVAARSVATPLQTPRRIVIVRASPPHPRASRAPVRTRGDAAAHAAPRSRHARGQPGAHARAGAAGKAVGWTDALG